MDRQIDNFFLQFNIVPPTAVGGASTALTKKRKKKLTVTQDESETSYCQLETKHKR